MKSEIDFKNLLQMQIQTFSRPIPAIVILADEGFEGKLNLYKITLCKDAKILLEKTNYLSQTTFVLNEEFGGAPETTGLLFEGFEHSGIHKESFPSWNDPDENMHSLLREFRNITKKNERVCIICGTENSFRFITGILTRN